MIFDLSYKEAAQALIGRTLIAGPHYAVILHAQGFPRASNDTGVYKPVLIMRPGDVFTPRMRNAILTLIACNDGNSAGGCILLRTIELDGREIADGPNNVSRALGVTIPKDPGRIKERSDDTLELIMARLGPSVLPQKRPSRRLGIGKAVLQKHLPAIVKRFLAMPADGRMSFESLLGTLLEGCENEADLRRRIRS